MKLIVTGSLGNIGKPLTKKLIAAGHQVTVVSSAAARKAAIEELGATAAIGSVNDAAFLEQVFAGADAVWAMTPPNMRGDNAIATTTEAGKAFAAAFRKAGIQRVVMLSSIGADLPGGNGPIAGLHNIEQLYSQLEGVAVTYLRAGFFYTNYYNDIALIKGGGIIGANYPALQEMLLVHPEDIAAAAAEELQQSATGQQVRYVVSDIRTTAEVAAALGNAVGIPALPWVEFTDEAALQGMINAGLPEEFAGLYTEMGVGLRNGSIIADFRKRSAQATGNIKLEDFAKEFAERFK